MMMMTMQGSVPRHAGEKDPVGGCERRGVVGSRDTAVTTNTYTYTTATTEAQTVPTTKATVTRPASGIGGPKRNGPTPMLPALLCLIALFWLQPVAAVLVPFDNCLPASYIAKPDESSPSQAQLQWAPKYVDVFFDLEHDSHNLRVTVYGNVTGRVGNAQLPLWNDPIWHRNDGVLDGKIRNQPDSSGMATTLLTKVEFLSYEPYRLYSNFCNNVKNGSCPLGPVFTPNVSMHDLPSLDLSTNLSSTYAFASLAPTFIVWWGNEQATSIGCVAAIVTPSLGSIAWFLKFLPAIALILVGFATLFAAVFSPWGTTNIFHWSSNFGRDPDLLRLVTPGFGDCLQYIQFIALTGGLSLDYPGFYQPAVSNGAWSALMFNESFVSGAAPWQSIVDGIYVTNMVDGVYDGSGIYGLEAIARLVGMSQVEDVWAGMMVWLLVIVLAAVVLTQLGFFLRWLLRYISENPEEDLRAKNLPFTVGNVIRVVFNFFLLPIVTLSTFQLVVAGRSAFFLVALAVVTIVLIIGFAVWLMYLIATTRPRAHLFDDLPTVLLYGPLYNTYSDEAAAFALIPIILTLLRGIAVGAVQPSGIAQLVILAVCEVIQMLTLHAFRPFHSSTSMNAYHTGFAALRFITVMLMVAFAPSMGVTEGPKGWIGYAILLIHGAVLVFGFFLNAVQTIVEVIARMYGAGGDDVRGQTRGGLSKIFGARQLQRRIPRQGATSRASQISTAAMLNADRTSKRGYGRIRSESAGSMGIHLHEQHRISSILEAGHSVDAFSLPPGSAFTPTTPGEASTFSFLPPPGQATRPQPAADPYYRPPRAKRTNNSEDMGSSPPRINRGSTGSLDLADRRLSKPMPFPDMADMEGSGRVTPAPPQAYAPVFAPRADYSTREVDFYYGVRGPALNSDAPGRRLGTGPADPTSPITTATGWLRGLFGGKTKEKGKGFEVVRSARMPPAMKARGGDFGDDDPPEGIPVAMGVLRNGPIDSDDEDGDGTPTKKGRAGPVAAKGVVSDEDGNAAADNGEAEASSPSRVARDPPLLPDLDAGGSFRFPSRAASVKTNRQASQRTVREIRLDLEPVPDVPRKSSKRNSSVDKFKNPLLNLVPPEEEPGTEHTADRSEDELGTGYKTDRPPSRLPFDRSNSQKRMSVSSLAATEDPSQATPGSGPVSGDSGDERPTSYGHVPHQSVSSSRFDPSSDQRLDLLGSAAELVDDGKRVSPGSSVSAGSRRGRRT